MTVRLRTLFFIGLTLLAIWFLYVERAILTPFVLAAIFAYVFNPLVNFFTHKVKLPRTISILIIYLFLVAIIVFLGLIFVRRIIEESSELRLYITTLVKGARVQINTLPDYIRPTAYDALVSLEKSKIFSPAYLFTLFPQAISRIVSFFIFLVAGFYFLKEGDTIFDKILNFVPNDFRVDVEILFRRVNKVFGSYLRGQILLVVLVSLVLFIALSILGVKFALVLAVFSGFAEIIPIIGPVVAGAVATLVTLISGVSNFSILPFQAGIIVVIIYFVVRELEDYFVIPKVMSKIADLHPLIILFAVIAGGHLLGVLGLIMAVPIAAVIKILLTFSLDKINQNNSGNKKVLGRQ